MADAPQIKIPPHSKDSEMMVLGCMLTSINSLNVAADMLSDSHFYYSEHKTIFRILQEAYKKDKPVDVHLVCEELKRLEKLEGIGGVSFVTTLAQYAGTSAYIEEYCEIVRNKSLLRQMIHVAQDVEKTALSDPDDVQVALDDAQGAFFQISQTASTDIGVHIKDVLSGVKAESGVSYIKKLQEKQERFQELGPEEGSVSGVSTGLADLDKMISGFQNSNLMILAARPAMGKTALALNLAENICFKLGVPTAVFSLEMSAEQLVHRMICSQSEVESDKIRTGSLSGLEFQRVVSTVGEMQQHNLIVDDQPGLKVTDLRARARRMKENFNIGFIVIDYLQLLSGSGNSRSMESRQVEISEISRMLKNLARELDIPILCLSQLSRKVEERTGHRPMMSDLRESGSIEQDADIVFFLLRREYYDPNDKPGMGELIIGKNRHGGIGSVNLTFRKEIAQFADYSPLEAYGNEESDNAEAFNDFTP